MKSICIDIGNTRYKVGFFEENNLISTLETQKENEVFSFVNDFIEKYSVENIMIASVRVDLVDFILKLPKNKLQNIFSLSADLPVPLKNHYQTPKTLGTDRIAGMCGAEALFPNQHCLVIDIGTCITYDLIDKEANFFGGTISPGVRMRLRAMHEFTQKLPLLEWNYSNNYQNDTSNDISNGISDISQNIFPNVQGNSTKEAILSGAINGVMMEIQGIIHHFEHLYEDLHIILCGGDAFYFEKSLKGTIFARPELVLYGLNRILQYNVKKN